MKLFTATARTQGQRSNDFTFCVEGELVMYYHPICPSDQADPDGPCGCGRSFGGLASHEPTTTAMVRAIPDVTLDRLAEAIASSLDEQGWCSDMAADMAADLAENAADYPPGTVLERRLSLLIVRSYPPLLHPSDWSDWHGFGT